MDSESGAEQRPAATPGGAARWLAIGAIVIAGICGFLIRYAFVDLQCEGDCALPKGLGILTGAVIAAGGMAIVAVLVMRALGEWHEIQDREAAGHAPR